MVLDPPNRTSPLALLVGSREPLLRALRKWLEGGEYTVTTTRSGREGFTRARYESPELIVADVEQPDMTILELCRKLRDDALANPPTPVLVMSRDEVDRERRLAILEAGAWECLVWPWDPEAVLLRVRAYTQGKLSLERARTEGLVDLASGLYNSRGLARRARELGSHAFRSHQSLACVMISIEVGAGATMVPASDLVNPVAVALQATARPSDPKGRLTATDFAVLAPGANEGGAQSMATRLKQAVQNAIEMAGLPPGTCRVIVAYDAVANLAYTPVEPTEILARATTALRDRRRFAES